LNSERGFCDPAKHNFVTFRRCVTRYRGAFKVKSVTCLDQFLCMAFAQLTFRESLRDIEVCLRAQSSKLYHLGIRSAVDANAVRDWRIYADFAQSLIGIARRLYAQESFGVDLQETVYALYPAQRMYQNSTEMRSSLRCEPTKLGRAPFRSSCWPAGTPVLCATMSISQHAHARISGVTARSTSKTTPE
jgi:hypothetical protein